MIDLECPSCGRGGSIPHDKVNTRLVCKKCHKVFHVNTAGRTLLGEPQAEAMQPTTRRTTADGFAMPSFEPGRKPEGAPADVSPRADAQRVRRVRRRLDRLVLPDAAPPSLEAASKELAAHLADDDLAYLKAASSADTAKDTVRWFDAVHPGLVKTRNDWKTRHFDVRVMVIDENRRQRIGQSEAFLYPGQGASHTAKVEDAANAANTGGPAMVQPVNLKLYWVLDRGNWRIERPGDLPGDHAGTVEHNLHAPWPVHRAVFAPGLAGRIEDPHDFTPLLGRHGQRSAGRPGDRRYSRSSRPSGPGPSRALPPPPRHGRSARDARAVRWRGQCRPRGGHPPAGQCRT